jgi:hypothetical protein
MGSPIWLCSGMGRDSTAPRRFSPTPPRQPRRRGGRCGARRGTGALELRHCSVSVRSFLCQTHFVEATVRHIDLERRVVHAFGSERSEYALPYDRVVLAAAADKFCWGLTTSRYGGRHLHRDNCVESDEMMQRVAPAQQSVSVKQDPPGPTQLQVPPSHGPP